MESNRNFKILIILAVISIIPVTSSKTEQSSKEIDPQNQNPVLLIHGYGGNWGGSSSFHMKQIRDWLVEDGFNFKDIYGYSFENPLNCSFQTMIDDANNIKQWIDNILTEQDSDKVDIIAYSQGGVSARYYVKFLDANNSVDDFVTLGTQVHWKPEWDVPFCATSIEAQKNLMVTLNEGDETPGGILNDTLGTRQDPLNPTINYNGTHVPGDINYTSIYSSEDINDPNYSPLLDGAYNTLVDGVTHANLPINSNIYSKIKLAIEDFEIQLSNTTSSESSLETSYKTSDSVSSSPSTTNYSNAWIPIVILIWMLSIRKRRNRK